MWSETLAGVARLLGSCALFKQECGEGREVTCLRQPFASTSVSVQEQVLPLPEELDVGPAQAPLQGAGAGGQVSGYKGGHQLQSKCVWSGLGNV